jgi:cytochrome P450
VASEDIEYGGVLFPEGTLVSVSLAAGNRDPATFGIWGPACLPLRFDPMPVH